MKSKRPRKRRKKLEKSLGKSLNSEIGGVEVEGELLSEGEFYEYTLAAKEYEAYEQEIAATVQKLKDLFPNSDEQQLKQLARSEKEAPKFQSVIK